MKVWIAAKGMGDLDGLPTVRGVIDIHRHRPTEHVAVIAPHEHFLAVDVPSVNAIERMEVPAGLLGILGRVGPVVAAIAMLDDNLAMRLEVVGAQEELLPGGEENVSVLQ